MAKDYTNIPNSLRRDRASHKITARQFLILDWLRWRAKYHTGIAEQVSADQILAEIWDPDAQEEPTKRTVQKTIAALHKMGYIVSGYKQGHRGTYPVTVCNYKTRIKRGKTVKEVLLNPAETIGWRELSAQVNGEEDSELTVRKTVRKTLTHYPSLASSSPSVITPDSLGAGASPLSPDNQTTPAGCLAGTAAGTHSTSSHKSNRKSKSQGIPVQAAQVAPVTAEARELALFMAVKLGISAVPDKWYADAQLIVDESPADWTQEIRHKALLWATEHPWWGAQLAAAYRPLAMFRKALNSEGGICDQIIACNGVLPPDPKAKAKAEVDASMTTYLTGEVDDGDDGNEKMFSTEGFEVDDLR